MVAGKPFRQIRISVRIIFCLNRMDLQKSKASVRRQLMDALRTQDVRDLETAINNATALAAPHDSAAPPPSAAHLHLSRGGAATPTTSSAASQYYSNNSTTIATAMEQDGLLLESKKMYLRLMGHCKHLVKPLRRSLRNFHGPGIVESLDRVYRAPAAVQKMMEKDTREGERTLRHMSHAALDAKAMFSTDRWEEVDRFLHTYSSVLSEDVVVELSNIRDTLLSINSPHKNHVSPSASQQRASVSPTEVSVSPSMDRGSPLGSSVPPIVATSVLLSPQSNDERNNNAVSIGPTPAVSPVPTARHNTSYVAQSPSSANASVVLLRQKLLQYSGDRGDARHSDGLAEHHHGFAFFNASNPTLDVSCASSARLHYDERRRMQLRIAKQLAPEEFDARQEVCDDELSERVAIFRQMLHAWTQTRHACSELLQRLDALTLRRPYYPSPSRSTWVGPDQSAVDDEHHHHHHRRRYRFLRLHRPSSDHSSHPHSMDGEIDRQDDDGFQQHASTAVHTRRQLMYQYPSVSVNPAVPAGSTAGGRPRSAAPSPPSRDRCSVEHDIALALGIGSSAASSAAASAEPSRTSSPVPLHPTAELHHHRPPLAAVGASRFSPQPEKLSAESVAGLDEGEGIGRAFIQDKEVFSRGVELEVSFSRIQLHHKAFERSRRDGSDFAATQRPQRADGQGGGGEGDVRGLRVTLSPTTPEEFGYTAARQATRSRSGDAAEEAMRYSRSRSSGHNEEDRSHTSQDGLELPVRLGRWGMNRDPYSSFDHSPERVESAPGTTRHHSEALSLKSPSPPSASDDDA